MRKLNLVGTYKVRQSGKRGMSVSLPASYFQEIGIKPSDKLNLYRDPVDKKILIIKPIDA